MAVEINISEKILVHSPSVNENTKKWGVYSIPRMWRIPSGRLVVRLNGEMDSGDTDHMETAPNLYFVSDDNGDSWTLDENGEEHYPSNVCLGIDPPYTTLGDGSVVAYREKPNRAVIEDSPHTKEFMMPNGEAIVYSYRYSDIPVECKGLEMLRFKDGSSEAEITDAVLSFDEREILINAKGNNGVEFVDVAKKVKQCIFKNPYISSVTPLPDGSLGALSCGQNPGVCDHYSGAVYFVISVDGGKTWTKKADVALSDKVLYGYGGDGHEVSLAITTDNTLVCAMRMEMSINPDVATPVCDTMISLSTDMGESWCEPFSVADSSVTPHVVALKDNIVVLVYGRPGVHIKVSEDGGRTWSESHSIIGDTLDECRAKGIKDADSKYFDTSSYSNTFFEKISDDTFLLLYNDMKNVGDDGLCHKTAYVKRINVKKKHS